MRNNPVLAVTIFSLIILLIDSYSYWGIRKIVPDVRRSVKRLIDVLYWIVPAGIIIGIILIFVFQEKIPGNRILSYFHIVSGAFIIFYIPKLVFIVFNIFDDVIFQIRKMITRKKQSSKDFIGSGKMITRRKLLNQVGIIFAGVPFISLIYGVAHGRFDFIVRKHNLKFPNLPEKFNGLKVVQISDFHLGSFLDYEDMVNKVVELVNQEHADLLLFTGDFVNNLSTEIDEFLDTLKTMQATLGKYSILGNHDYGEYVPWESEQEKRKNLERIIRLQKDIGFDILLNESRKIKIADEEIELIGVENWGLPPFPQYGDLRKAMENVDTNSFKILMSHDPKHWEEQVFEKTNIDLTLSGHTHGAQFGIEIPGWRWSPATVRYQRWGGLYTEGEQRLYINTGLGSIGYPGRVGMPPEITVIRLLRG